MNAPGEPLLLSTSPLRGGWNGSLCVRDSLRRVPVFARLSAWPPRAGLGTSLSAAVRLQSPLRKVRENPAQSRTGEVAGLGEKEMSAAKGGSASARLFGPRESCVNVNPGQWPG